MGYEFYRHNQVKYETPFLFPPVGGKNLILFEFFSPFGGDARRAEGVYSKCPLKVFFLPPGGGA